MNKHLSDIEDQLLVMDAQVGDAEAMEKLVGRWQKTTLVLCLPPDAQQRSCLGYYSGYMAGNNKKA